MPDIITMTPVLPPSPTTVTIALEQDPTEPALVTPGTPGALVLSWLTPDAAAYVRTHHRLDSASIRTFVSRASLALVNSTTVLGGPTLAAALPAHDTPLLPVVVWADRDRFWSSLLDGTPDSLIGVADAPPGRAPVVLRIKQRPRPQTSSSPSVCQEPRSMLRVIPDRDGRPHRVCIRRADDTVTAREPRIVYMLPGLGGREHVRFQDRTLIDEVDRWSRDTGHPVVLVGIDASTAAGSDYIGTAETPWAHFLTHELVTTVEAELGIAGSRHRSVARRRVIAGQSTGGFNAMMLAMTRPGVFDAVAASAPDALDFAAWLLGPDGRVKDSWLAWMRFEDVIGGEGVMRSYAAAWSGNEHGDIVWPVDLTTGQTVPDRLGRWLCETPAWLLEQPAARTALHSLEGRLFIGAARNDEFDLFEPAARFSDRLQSLGIHHQLSPDDDGHFAAQQRMTALIRRALDSLAADT